MLSAKRLATSFPLYRSSRCPTHSAPTAYPWCTARHVSVHSLRTTFRLNQTERISPLFIAAIIAFCILRFTFLTKRISLLGYRNLPSVSFYFAAGFHSFGFKFPNRKRQTVFPFEHRIFDNNRLPTWHNVKLCCRCGRKMKGQSFAYPNSFFVHNR